MRRLTLVEHEPHRAVRLTRAEREALRVAIPELLIAPSSGQLGGPGRYDVTPGSWVGVASAGDLLVEIAPKLAVENVLFLVSYALTPDAWRVGPPVPLGARDGLVEAMAALFCTELCTALRYGLLRGYVTREDALAAVRGRIRIDEQLRRRLGRTPPLELRFDELTEDIPENRLLKSALGTLARLPLRSRAIVAQLRHLLPLFESVTPLPLPLSSHSRGLPEVTRLNERYRRALSLARIILDGGSVEARLGVTPSLACLFDMDRVFEQFVVVALREALALTEWSFPRAASGHGMTLDRAGELPLEPDLSWWDGTRCAFVGDVKYKRTALGEHSDLYQLLAYVTAAQLPGGLLVYAAGDEAAGAHTVHDVDGKSLHVATLDLSTPPEQLLSQIALLAQRIKHLRLAARTVTVA